MLCVLVGLFDLFDEMWLIYGVGMVFVGFNVYLNW